MVLLEKRLRQQEEKNDNNMTTNKSAEKKYTPCRINIDANVYDNWCLYTIT